MPRCELCDHYDTDPCIPNDERAADRLYRYHDIVAKLDELEAEIEAVESIPMDVDLDHHHVQGLLDEIELLQEQLDQLLAEEVSEKQIKSDAAAWEAFEAEAEALVGDSVGANVVTVEASAEFYEFDISHEESRVYVFHEANGDVTEVEIDLPRTLYVDLESGDHHIVDQAGVGSVVSAGWREITIYPRLNETPFKFID